MKGKRQEKILDIIRGHTVTTQEELQARLADAGFSATQATISRDIRELRLIKALSPAGGYYYTLPPEPEALSLDIDPVFLDAITAVDHAGNFAVVKCYSGMANAVCVAIDTAGWEGLVGTIAGDDTIFLLLRSERRAEVFADFLWKLVEKARSARKSF